MSPCSPLAISGACRTLGLCQASLSTLGGSPPCLPLVTSCPDCTVGLFHEWPLAEERISASPLALLFLSGLSPSVTEPLLCPQAAMFNSFTEEADIRSWPPGACLLCQPFRGCWGGAFPHCLWGGGRACSSVPSPPCLHSCPLPRLLHVKQST